MGHNAPAAVSALFYDFRPFFGSFLFFYLFLYVLREVSNRFLNATVG